MAIARQAILDYRTSGTDTATTRVVKLSEAVAAQEARVRRLAPALREAATQEGVLGAVAQASSARIGTLTNTLGPAGAGLAVVARQAPIAAMGILKVATASERASATSRALNLALMGGTAAVLTAGVALTAMADDIIRAGDNYATLHARIRTFTDGAVEAAQMERELYLNAKDARASVEGQVTLYTRLAPAIRDYGRSQQEALEVTKLVSKAQAIQGADIREQLASTIQFSQAVASGVLRGDELRSMLESSPQLLRYVAQNLDLNGKIGVAFSQLRNLGAAGTLTTERLIDALIRAAPQIERDFVNAPKTAQQGWQILTDQLTRTVGQLAQTSGLQQGVVDLLADMANGADAFRQKMLLDPHALDPIKEAQAFMGGLIGLLANVGNAGVENFDMIVQAGQLIIALKLGEVFAGWFATGAAKMREFTGSVEAFRAQAAFQAGATMSPTAARAAGTLRDTATASDLRAAELQAQAELKLAQAVAARTAADRAAVQAALAKREVGAVSVAAVQAEAAATALATAATRADEQAKKAQAAATSAAAAAATRNAVATEAEAIVTQNVTRAVVAKSAALRIANGLYTALGGAVGIASLAIGALVYAVWKAEEAYRAQVAAQRDALVVSDDLSRITQQMTGATWAQVPALQAQAQALRDNAAAASEEAKQQLALAEARRKALREQAEKMPPTTMEQAAGLSLETWRTEREVKDLQANLRAKAKDEWAASLEATHQLLVAGRIEVGAIQDQLRTGKDAAGRALSQSDRDRLKSRQAELFGFGQQKVDEFALAVRSAQAAINTPRPRASRDKEHTDENLNRLKGYSDALGVASELVGAAGGSAPGKPTHTASAPKTRVSAGVNQALTELIEQQYRPTGGGQTYHLKSGVIVGAGGGVFTARSEDEAAAAAKYVKQIQAINEATDAQIAKTGKSRDALREAASAMLANVVATSKASQAEEKWSDLQAEMTGQSRAVVKAQREVNDLIDAGANITKDAAAAYVAYVAARDRAQRMQRGLQVAEPAARSAYDFVSAGAVLPTDSHGVVNMEAATKAVEARRQAVMEESERRIRTELAKVREADGLTQEQYEQRLADAIAANRVAVETVLQDQLLDIQKSRIEQSRGYAEQRFGEIAGAFGDALDELRPNTGNKLIDDLLQQAWRELISNPLRTAIINALRETFTPQVGGASGGGGVGGFLSRIASSFFGGVFGGGSAAATSTGSSGTPGLNNGVGLGTYQMNFRRLAGGGWARGPGGPRGDKIRANLSDGEFVVNAVAAQRNADLLEAINSGTTAKFASGGWATGVRPGGSGSSPNVQVNNYMGGQAEVQTSQAPDGGLKIDLVPLAQDMMSGALASPAGAKALRKVPLGPKRRG